MTPGKPAAATLVDRQLRSGVEPDLLGHGNPAPDFDGDVRKGDNLYTESMVALDADTGKLKWYFQYTPHDVHDWDAVEIPVLVDAAKASAASCWFRPIATALAMFDRTNGKFLHGSPFINQLNWAKGLTPEGRPIRVPGVVPTIQGTRTCPATAGATNWHSPAYSPRFDTGLFYVTIMEGCGINYKSRDTFRPWRTFMATGYVEDAEAPWQAYVRALDLTTGKLKWEYKQIGPSATAPD